MGHKEIEAVKKELCTAYEDWCRTVDQFDCGLRLTHYISASACEKLQRVISATERLTVLDPDCLRGVFDQLEGFRKLMEAQASETEVASRELAGVDL